MKVLILAGGSGDRLFPLSRENIPKQFIKISEFGETSLFQKTVKRALEMVNLSDIYISTNSQYENIVTRQLNEIVKNGLQKNNIILEQEKKNTLFAITHGLKHINKCIEHIKYENRDFLKTPVVIMPSDHMVSDNIINDIKYEADIYTNGHIILFGLATNKTNNQGYGYIVTNEESKIPLLNDPDILEKLYKRYIPKIFLEKPDENVLKMYKDGSHNLFINSGIFLLSPHTFFNMLKIYNGKYYSTYFDSVATINDLPNISIDKGLLELLPINILRLHEIECEWTDVGDFSRLHTYSTVNRLVNLKEMEEDKNIININSSNNFIKNNGNKKVCLIGIDNLIVIDTNDIILICNLNKTDLMKDLITKIKNTDPKILKQVDLEYRNWGYYEVLLHDESRNYKIKRIYIDTGKHISLQKHLHRKEMWTIVHGVANVTLNDETTEILEQGTTITVNIGEIHKVENVGKIPLEIIEIQLGEYLEEDDIIRIDKN